ncbi:hypothetical protein [Corynebacterium curieae]|nr:hypothetical protein [Corynebacterium curieae]
MTAKDTLLADAPLPLTESKKKPHRRALVRAKGDGVGRALTKGPG